ncbi:MAG: hypothetical protein AABY84_09425 [Candidatus Firestonebacteria bacterium]
MVKKLIVIGLLVFAGIYSEAFGEVLQDDFRKASITDVGRIEIEYKGVNVIAKNLDWYNITSWDNKQRFIWMEKNKTDVSITKEKNTIKAVITNNKKEDIDFIWTKILTMTDKDIIIDFVIRIEPGTSNAYLVTDSFYLSNDIIENSTYEAETVAGNKETGELLPKQGEYIPRMTFLKINSSVGKILFQFEGLEGDDFWRLMGRSSDSWAPSRVECGFYGKCDNKIVYERHLRIIISF